MVVFSPQPLKKLISLDICRQSDPPPPQEESKCKNAQFMQWIIKDDDVYFQKVYTICCRHNIASLGHDELTAVGLSLIVALWDDDILDLFYPHHFQLSSLFFLFQAWTHVLFLS